MNFEELNNMIPYAKGGKEKVLRMTPYPGVTLAMPGRHAKETIPQGGDFVVMIGSKEHQFKHNDIFNDIESKTWESATDVVVLMDSYLSIITGDDPENFDGYHDGLVGTGIDPYLFLRAVQCLAVAEHRRYAKFEPQIGGRYLPFRFAAGIVDASWMAIDCISHQKLGRPGVETLEKTFGVPKHTQELFGCLKKN